MYLLPATVLGLASTACAMSIASRRPSMMRMAFDDSNDDDPLPLVIWHGLGDNYQAEGLKSVGELAEKTIPGLYVYYIRLDDNASQDRSNTFFGNMSMYIDQVCEALASDPILSTAPAVNALGFSQGGQFLRAYVEKCNNPPVANLVTFGSQHNGIAQFQECGDGDWLCKSAEYILRSSTWSSFVQGRVVPAQYFRDPEDLESYLEYSNFLADINNERELKNPTYAANMKKLEKFVMYVFEDDITVVPKVSGWFSEYNATSEKETSLRDRQIYKEDWLGLRWLDEKGRLEFLSTPGAHMQLSDKVLLETFRAYFSGPAMKYQPYRFGSQEL